MGASYVAIGPELLLVGAAVLVLMVDVFADPRPRVHAWIMSAAFISVVILLLEQWERADIVRQDPQMNGISWGGAMILNHQTVGFKAILLIVTVLGAATAWQMLVDLGRRTADGVSLVLIAAAGFMLMASSLDLVMLFVALEIGSIALYVLAGIVRSSPAADEAAMKYFLLGAFASAIFVYGAALTFAGTGSTQLLATSAFLSQFVVLKPGVILIGMALLIVGMAFKVTAAPFHSWAPDVYQGAPSGAVGFMAAAAKVGGFAALINILFLGFGRYQSAWSDGLAILAVLSVVLGTLLAIQQTDVRRMLAYSGVGHAGFILMGVSAGIDGLPGVFFYLATYSVMLVASFAAVTVVSGSSSSASPFDAYIGLGKRSPVVAGSLTVLMLGLSGMPLTSGFIGKFQVFSAAWDNGLAWLVIVALLASVAAFFFYLRLIVVMYFQSNDDGDRSEVTPNRSVRMVLLFSAVATLVFGIFPSPILDLVNRALGG